MAGASRKCLDIGDGLHDERPEHDEDRQVVAFEKPLATSDRARSSGDHGAVRKAEKAVVPEKPGVAGSMHRGATALDDGDVPDNLPQPDARGGGTLHWHKSGGAGTP